MTVRTVVRIFFLQLLYVQWLQQLLEIFIKITVRTVTSLKSYFLAQITIRTVKIFEIPKKSISRNAQYVQTTA